MEVTNENEIVLGRVERKSKLEVSNNKRNNFGRWKRKK
jgi:hypothetical protein